MAKKHGDRRDGVWLKDIDGFHAIMPYLMPNRCDNEVYIEEALDVTSVMKYLKKKNGQGAPYKTTAFHIFTTAVAKTVYHRPLLNRYIAGKRFYQRKDITLCFVVKRKFKDNAEESLLVVKADPDMTLTQMSHKILGDSHKIREDNGNSIDKLLGKLAKLPRFIMRFVMFVFRFLDFHGKMPESICQGDCNYATVLLSNLGSIKCDAAYHHLNNYGTNSIVITIGKIHKDQIVGSDGNIKVRDVVKIGATVDERIADGFYFAKSIRLLEKILANPEDLEKPIKEETRDAD
ncbi:MAG: 2-oxo acid dehydrogenase subunit E2 [Clostridiales bacterium]|nr:2-oxo acid dehydrogenase subunit E2 [Clostridiales bacterium]